MSADTFSNITSESLAKHILGTKTFDDFGQYVCGVFRRCQHFEEAQQTYYFVVLITRRCNAIVDIFLHIIWSCLRNPQKEKPEFLRAVAPEDLEKWYQIARDHFVTDTSLLLLADPVAQRFSTKGEMPHLLVLDEALRYGKTINNLLYRYEKQLAEHNKIGLNKFESAREVFLKNLSLSVFSSWNEMFYLFSRYIKRMEVRYTVSPDEMNSLSRRFSLLLSLSEVPNTGYTWSLNAWQQMPRTVAPMASAGPFFKLESGLRNIHQATYIWLYPNAAAPRIVCTVRKRTSLIRREDVAATASPLYRTVWTPFLIFGSIPLANHWKLHDLLVRRSTGAVRELLTCYETTLSPGCGKVSQTYAEWLMRIHQMFLGAMLAERLRQTLLEEPGILPEEIPQLSCDRMARSFFDVGYQINAKKPFESIEKMLNAAVDFCAGHAGELETYLSVLTENTLPLGSDLNGIELNAVQRDDLLFADSQKVWAVEDAAARLGYEAENAAFQMQKYPTSNEVRLSRPGAQVNLTNLLKRCSRELVKRGQSASLYEVIAIIVQLMELGVLAMQPGCALDPHIDTDAAVSMTSIEDVMTMESLLYTHIRTGDQVQFLWPRRYQSFIPLVSALKHRSGPDPDRLLENLLAFARRCAFANVDLWKDLAGDSVPPTDDEEDLLTRNRKAIKEVFAFAMAEEPDSTALWRRPIIDEIPMPDLRTQKPGTSIQELNRLVDRQTKYLNLYLPKY